MTATVETADRTQRRRGGSPSAARRPPRRKALGQHHLRSGAACGPLLDFLAPFDGPVVEIGPGGGALTAELLARGACVWAFELDRAWAFHLRRAERCQRLFAAAAEEKRCQGLSLVVADALELPWERLPAGALVAGNLPYAVATPLIDRTLRAGPRVARAGFLVQLEVAERLCASPGERPYGALSVLTQLRARPCLLARLGPRSFRPAPKVESAFVGLLPLPPPLAESEMPALERFVRLAFAQPRKTLLNNLAAAFGRDRALAALAALGPAPSARPGELGPAEWVDLSRRLQLD